MAIRNDSTKLPLISIITVVFNAATTLKATIESILTQNSTLFEYIIIDGGSTDGSLDIINNYKNSIVYYSSEPDEGIYDAMNKGISKAKGNWLYFIGGDDILIPDILDKVAHYLAPNLSIVFGNVLFDNGHIMRSFFGSRTILQNTVHHQSAFYNRSLFDLYKYDTSIQVVSEYELHLKIYTNNLPFLYIPILIAECATGGASSQLSQSLIETNQIRSRFVTDKWKQASLSVFLKLYYAQKRLRFYLYGHRV